MRVGGLLVALSLIGCTYSTDPIGEVGAASTGTPTDCWIAGAGTIDPAPGETDAFAGEARQTAPGATTAVGTWSHRADAGDLLVGTVAVLSCRANGGFGPGDPVGSRA